MDRKSVIVLVVCFALLVLWFPLVNRLYPPKPQAAPEQAAVVQPAQSPVLTATPSVDATDAPARTEAPAEDEKLIVLENDNGRYTFTSHGGGLKSVDLLHYPEVIDRHDHGKEGVNGLATLNTAAALPVLALTGDSSLAGDGVFHLERLGREAGVRAWKMLPNGLRVVKEFRLSTNYLVNATARFENPSAQPVTVPSHEWAVGAATPMSALDDGLLLGIYWYNGAKAEHIERGWFDNKTLGCFPGTPRAQYRDGASNVVWTAVHNQYFALATVPGEPALEVAARKIDLPGPTPEEIAAHPKATRKPVGFQTSLVYSGATLAPGQALERDFTLYAGPREYRTLAQFGGQMGNNLDQIMGYGGFFGFFSKALLLSMNKIHSWGLSYGWSIVVITILVKLLFWPLTNASTKSMKRMAALQPQMKAIQEKYKDEPQKMNRKLMEFMKENKVNPMGGCLPMLLQMPVFFGFFFMIRSAIELRGAEFLWAFDLSKPDTLFVIPGINFPFNPLPLIMGVTMLWQARLTPPSPGMDPMQQKIMRYMPLMFMVFLYNFSAGLTLYWTVQNLLTILQTKLTKTKTEPVAPATPPARPAAPVRKKKQK